MYPPWRAGRSDAARPVLSCR